MSKRLTPLHGTKTHPLTTAAREVLRMLATGPQPRQVINAGVCNRLEREELVEVVWLPSPYKTRKGTIQFLQITEAGRREVPDA